MIGCCGVRRDRFDSRGDEIGYELDPDTWGHGYALEAMREILDLAFGELGLDWLTGCSVARNRRAIRLRERLAMRPICRLQACVQDGLAWPERMLYILDRRDSPRPRDRFRTRSSCAPSG